MKFKLGDVEFEASLDAQDVEIIRAKTPVVTGRLRDGFHLNAEGGIDNDVEYGPEVELGTSTRPGRFMVEQSLNEIEGRAAKHVIEKIEERKIIKDMTINVKV
jgi:hypothetical protein